MKDMTLENIARVCGGVYHGGAKDKQKCVTGAVIDSLLVEP